MKLLLVLSLLVGLVFATQYVPIVKRQVGILIGNPNADVKLSLIYDPACDGSAALDATLQQVWSQLSSDIQNKISLRFMSLSLPYHIASQKLTQAIIYVQQAKGNNESLTLFRDFLTNIDKYDEDNIQNETIGGLMIRIAQRVNTLFGLKAEDVLKELAHGSSCDAKTRQWSKVAMGAIRASSTPRLMINGVNVDNVVEMSTQQIVDLIKSLFSTSEEDEIFI